VFSRKPTQADLAILEVVKTLKEQNQKPATDGNSLYSFKNLNALAIAAIIGLGAFIWTGVTEQPQKNADQFSSLQTSSAEIRTTAMETKTAVVALNNKFDAIQRDASETKSKVDKNAAQIDALEQGVKANSERLSQLERDTR
jgi:uncharacterized protein HemX